MSLSSCAETVHKPTSPVHRIGDGANTAQLGKSARQLISYDAEGLVDFGRNVIHAGDGGKGDQCSNQGVFDKILAGLIMVEVSNFGWYLVQKWLNDKQKAGDSVRSAFG